MNSCSRRRRSPNLPFRQRLIEGLLGRREVGEGGGGRVRLGAPLVAMGEQGGLVHQDGPGVGEAATHPAEDGEAVGVDVSPVDDVQAGEPGQRAELPGGVAAAVDDDGPRREWERQVGDLVLDDERAAGARWRRGQLVGTDGKLGKACDRDGATEPDVAGLAEEPVAILEPLARGVHAPWRKHQVQQLGEDTAVPADELGVDAGNVDLAQVAAGGVASENPVGDR